jgi:hypothetical protein
MSKITIFLSILFFSFLNNVNAQKYDVFKFSSMKNPMQMPVIGTVDVRDSVLYIDIKYMEIKSISIKKMNEYTLNSFRLPSYILEMTSTDNRYNTQFAGGGFKIASFGFKKKKNYWSLQMNYMDEYNVQHIDTYTMLPSRRR